MPSSDVNWAVPLVRQHPIFPGQFGVPGSDNELGLRTSTLGAVYYVDPNSPGATTGADGTNPDNPPTTIQAAINKCENYHGDMVVVANSSAWQYAPHTAHPIGIAESVVLNKAGVRLLGRAEGGLGVPWAPAANLGTCLTVTAMDCTVEGFAFWSGSHAGADGILAVWDGGVVHGENLTVRHCTFDPSIDTAIELDYAYNCSIHDNVFQQVDVAAIYVAAANSPTIYTAIHDNDFWDCALAISMAGGGADNCSIYSNRIQGNAAGTNNFIDLTGGAENIVCNNWLGCSIAQYDVTCSDSTSGAWMANHCIDADTTAAPV